MEEPVNRQDPRNIELEASVLGSILTNNRTYDRVCDILLPEHFHMPVHGRIYQAIALRIDKGENVTPMSLMEFEHDPDLADAGRLQYVYELVLNVVSHLSARQYAGTIRDLFVRRRFIEVCTEAIAEAHETYSDTAAEVVERHEESVYEITKGPVASRLVNVDDAFETMLDRLDEAMKRDTRVIGVPTGLNSLDNLLGGLQEGKLIVIGARPSMGKTALICCILWHAANEGYKVALFSIEMEDYQIAARFGATETAIKVTDIDRGNVTVDQWGQLADVMRQAHSLDLRIEASGRVTVAQIRAQVRRLKRRGLDMVAIDYLGLVEPSSSAKRQNRVEQISEITRELKQMSKDFSIPVVLLAQLNRDLERREDKRPILSDLRESGSVEQDADTVIFLYRDEYYQEKSEPARTARENDFDFQERYSNWLARKQEVAGVCEAIIAKNRQGPVRTVKLHFDGATNRMTDHVRETAEEREFDL